MEALVNLILRTYQKRSTEKSQPKAERSEGLKALLTSRNTIRKGMKRYYGKVVSLQEVNVPFREMEKVRTFGGVKFKKARGKGEL